eukprot:gene7757-12227_t
MDEDLPRKSSNESTTTETSLNNHLSPSKISSRSSTKSNSSSGDILDIPEEECVLISLTIFGKLGVGKSKLIERILFDSYDEEESDPTISLIYSTKFTTNETNFEIEVNDTSGIYSEKNIGNDKMTEIIKCSKGFILVYDVTDKESLNLIKKIYNEIKKKSIYHQCVVIVGNKCDLKLNERGINQVKPQDTKELQKIISNRIQFYGSSAKEGINIIHFFEDLLKKSIERIIELKKNSIQNLFFSNSSNHSWMNQKNKKLSLKLIRDSFKKNNLLNEQEEEEKEKEKEKDLIKEKRKINEKKHKSEIIFSVNQSDTLNNLNNKLKVEKEKERKSEILSYPLSNIPKINFEQE